MPTAFGRASEIGNLVVLEVGMAEMIDGRLVQKEFLLLRHGIAETFRLLRPKPRSFLIGQAVGRDMMDSRLDGLV